MCWTTTSASAIVHHIMTSDKWRQLATSWRILELTIPNRGLLLVAIRLFLKVNTERVRFM